MNSRDDINVDSLVSQSPEPPPGAADDPLRQLRILYRQKWQILRIALAFIFVAVLVVFSLTPEYRGSATLLIEPVRPKVVAIDDVYDPTIPGANLTEYQNTQIEVLQSRSLAERVFDELDLAGVPEYQELAEDWKPDFVNDVLSLTPYGKSGADSGEVLRSDSIEELMDNIRIEPVLRSNLVRVHAESRDPELAAAIANAIVEHFINYDRETRGGIADEASGWLGGQLEEVKADLTKAEKALQAFYESEKLINVGGGARGLVEQEITDNESRLREARSKRTSLENVYQRIQASGPSIALLQEIPQIAQEPLVQTTKRLLLDAQNEVEALRPRYGAKHPSMIAATARLKDAQQSLENQVRQAADGIRSQYEIARSTERSLTAIVRRSRDQIQGLDRKGSQLQILQHEVESNRKLYDTLLQRSKETEITSELSIGKIRLIESASQPTSTHKPKILLWLGTATLFGLFLGVLIAVMQAYLDDTIKTPNEVEQATRLPVLTVLPQVNHSDRVPFLELDEPHGSYAEGVRTLRTSLLLADMPSKRKAIMVTSAVPGEGKTSLAMNLALVLGRVERVLLIDGDLRKPTIAKRMGLPADAKGILELLADSEPVSNCVHRHEQGGIDVIPCTTPPPNPLELVSSDRFAEVLTTICGDYDRIIIDSAPCQPVSDSLMLARLAQAVIYMVKAESTSKSLITNSVHAIRQAGAPLIGAILNQANTQKHSGFGYGYYYYRGRYGDGYSSKSVS